MAIKKEIKAYVECELRDYLQTIRDLGEERQQIIENSPMFDDSGIRGTDISRTCEKKALQLITSKRLKQIERTIAAIQSVLNELTQEQYKLVELKYWTKPQIRTDEGIAKELNIDKRTMYRWINVIVLAVSIELGLVDRLDCQKHVTFRGA
jgi:RinA family phage transcriptional activator